MFKKVKENKKGFTLAELLIVVAIIAVLVAISIPIFTAQLEKSREATDMANIRSAYAEVVSHYLTDDQSDYSLKVNLVSNTSDWKSGDTKLASASFEELINTQGKSGSVTVSVAKDGTVKIGATPIESVKDTDSTNQGGGSGNGTEGE